MCVYIFNHWTIPSCFALATVHAIQCFFFSWKYTKARVHQKEPVRGLKVLLNGLSVDLNDFLRIFVMTKSMDVKCQ